MNYGCIVQYALPIALDSLVFFRNFSDHSCIPKADGISQTLVAHVITNLNTTGWTLKYYLFLIMFQKTVKIAHTHCILLCQDLLSVIGFSNRTTLIKMIIINVLCTNIYTYI